MSLSNLFSRNKVKDKPLSDYIRRTFGFTPRNITLYQVAFTHKSKADAYIGTYHISNERMEYLGDTVLSTIVADYLFRLYPTQAEGFLTEMRSRIVSRNSLNKLSQKLGFEEHIRYTQIKKSNGISFRSLGGNVFEALVGAIYLDRGFEFTKRVIINRILLVHIDLDELQHHDTNFKSQLLEWAQKGKVKKHVEFRMLEMNVIDNKRNYHVQIFIDDSPYAEATDLSIKKAEQTAAEITLKMLASEEAMLKESEPQKQKLK